MGFTINCLNAYGFEGYVGYGWGGGFAGRELLVVAEVVGQGDLVVGV